jgi:Lipid-droplet associated hydrolase
MRELHRAFNGKAIVTSVSSVGFHTLDSGLHKQHQVFTLEQQCTHKASYFQQHIFSRHSLPVVVMGHSIGTYMAMQALHMCEGTTPSFTRMHKTREDCYRTFADGSAHAPDGKPRFVPAAICFQPLHFLTLTNRWSTHESVILATSAKCSTEGAAVLAWTSCCRESKQAVHDLIQLPLPHSARTLTI